MGLISRLFLLWFLTFAVFLAELTSAAEKTGRRSPAVEQPASVDEASLPAEPASRKKKRRSLARCKPDIKSLDPAGCFAPGAATVTLKGECFGVKPESHSVAFMAWDGKITKLAHTIWNDRQITARLRRGLELGEGAGGEIGIRDGRSTWVDKVGITICGTKDAKRPALSMQGKARPADKKKWGAAPAAPATSLLRRKISPNSQPGNKQAGTPHGNPPGPPVQEGVIVTHPPAGETLSEGDVYLVQWSYMGLPDTSCVHLDLFRGLVHKAAITSRLGTCGTTYSWTVPAFPYAQNYKIRARVVNKGVTDNSSPFRMLQNAPDLAIENARVLPAPSLYSGDTATFNAVIKNYGNTAPAINEATLTVLGPGGYSKTYDYNFTPLQARGQFHSVFLVAESFSVMTPGNYEAELRARFFASAVNPVNFASAGSPAVETHSRVNFTVSGRPDLVSCLFEEYEAPITKNRAVPVYVKNVGTAPSAPTTVRFYEQHKGTDIHPVPALPINGVWVYRVPQPAKKRWIVGKNRTVANVDPNDNVVEIDEGNNRRCGVVRKVSDPSSFNPSGVLPPGKTPPCSDVHPCAEPIPTVTGGN